MSKLYELTQTLNAAWQLIEDQAEDDGSFDSRLKSVLDAVQEEFDAKLQGCCQIVAEFDSSIEACEREAKRLRDRSGVLKGRIESLKSYMFDALKATQQTKVKTDLFTVSIRKNPGKVDITDQDVLPEKFVEIVVTSVPRKAALSAALKAGEVIPGAEFVQGERLHIQ